MPLLDSSEFSGGSVAHNASARTYTITGGVRVVDDELTAPTGGWPGYRIICNSSGGLRFTSGASGTLGEGVAPVVIIEESNGATYGGGDNYNSGGGTGSSARIAGGPTNTMIFDNVRWEIDSGGGRKDFDIARGDSSYNGPAVTFRGVEVIVSGSQTCFNHQASRNWKCEPSSYRPFGLRVTNYTNNAAWEFSSPITTPPTGAMVFIDTDPTNTANAHVAIQPGAIPANGVFQLVGLSCRRLAVVNGGSQNNTKIVRLLDPDGDIPRGNWSNEYVTNFEIVRTQPFAFTGANAAGTLYADAQDSNGRDANTAIPANGAASIQLLTQRSAHGASAWTAVNNFRFHAVGFGFSKYYSGTTNIAIATAPATRNVTLSPIALPDGTALSSKTSGAVETAADIINALHSYEVANPTYPALATRLLSISGATAQINTAELVLSTTASDFIARSGNTITLQCDSGGVDASNGVGLLNLGASYNAPSGTLNLIGFPTTSSTGTSALISITAPISQVYAYTNAGVQLGNHTLSSAGTTGFLVPASQALANTRVGCGRAGRPPQSRTIDISAGGTFAVEFQDLPAEVDALGNALYDSSATKPSVAFTTSSNPGRATFLLGNQSYTPKGLYRALHDEFSNPLGGRFVAFGRQNLGILQLGGAIPPAVFLGADSQLRRASSSGDNAAVDAFVLGGIGGNKINSDRGPIETGGSISTGGGGGSTDLTEVNTKLDAIQASADTLQEQNEHLATSLPLSFHEPLSPLCIVTGLEGQEIIRDTEETDWPLTASGLAGAGDGEAHGVVDFDGNNSHLDYSLNRAAAGQPADLYTSDIIVLMQIRPTSFPSAGQRPLANIGALTLSLNNSTGTTASLHLGAGPGATTTTAQVNLNAWNDLVFVFTQNPDRPNNPRVRVSINGAAQETGNLGADSTLGNNLFGPIASNTQNFRLGGHGTGSQTSGFQGQARAIFVHPDNEVFGTDGWDIPTGVYWNSANQLWQGAQLMDRVEGIAVDTIERKIDTIEEKTYTLDELGIAPWRAATSTLTSATGSIGKHLAELSDAPTASAVADAVLDEALSGHTTAGSAGAALSAAAAISPPAASAIAEAVNKYSDTSIVASSGNAAGLLAQAKYAASNVPSSASTAQAVWNYTIANSSASGSAGARLQATSTHDEPADSPAATDVAEAVWNRALSAHTTAGSAGKQLSDAYTGTPPTAQAIVDAVMSYDITTNIDTEKALQALLGAVLGTTAVLAGNQIRFNDVATGDEVARLTIGAGDGERTAVTIT